MRGTLPERDPATYCYNVLSVFTLFLDDFATNLDTEIPCTLPLLSIFKLIISITPTSSFPHSKCKLIDRSMLWQVGLCVLDRLLLLVKSWILHVIKATEGTMARSAICQFCGHLWTLCAVPDAAPDGQRAAWAFCESAATRHPVLHCFISSCYVPHVNMSKGHHSCWKCGASVLVYSCHSAKEGRTLEQQQAQEYQ